MHVDMRVKYSSFISDFNETWIWLAEGIWPSKLDQINADPEENWYRLAWKKID